MKTFIRTVNYVSLQNDYIMLELVFAGTDRQFILVLGFGTLCNDLIGRASRCGKTFLLLRCKIQHEWKRSVNWWWFEAQ